jgi:hypothetical protein
MIKDRPQPGAVIEVAIWLSGEETEDHLRRFREDDMPEQFRQIAEHWLLIIGPLMFSTKKPGADRVPPVPRHIHGTDVKLIVVEAEVLGWRDAPKRGSAFLADLTSDDLQKLRKATRAAHAKAHPGMPPLPDANCDAIINEFGPEAAYNLIKRLTDKQVAH